jgi:putative transposase
MTLLPVPQNVFVYPEKHCGQGPVRMNDPNQNPNTKSQNQALTRFRVINFIEDQLRIDPRLSEALRAGSLRPWPDENGDYYAPRTIEDWWYAYRKGGFEALQPATRSDHGKNRALDEATAQWVLEQVTQNPLVKFKVLYLHWKQQGRPLPSISVLYRFLRRHGYDRKSLRSGRLETGPTKAFEAPAVNDLWMVDFSPGPTLSVAGKGLVTHLCVLIDDHSRLIPFAGYYLRADTEAFHHALKEAVLRRGLPRKLYTDQGKPFINGHTRLVCAKLGLRLLHCKPYHSWSKGKIERVIQTLQQGFESTLRLEGNRAKSLEELNTKLSSWIQTIYHQRPHSSTDQSPEYRFQQAAKTLRHLEAGIDIDPLFYVHLERTVRKNATVRLDGQLYEVPLSLRALKIQLRLDPFRRARIEVWYQGKFMGLAKKAPLNLNSEIDGRSAYDR